MANQPSEPPSLDIVKYIETPLKTYYGVPEFVLWPYILGFIVILFIIGLIIFI